MIILEGLSASSGIAQGNLIFLASDGCVPTKQTVQDRSAEIMRADRAVETASVQLKELYNKALSGAGEETAAIFEVHSMILEDESFLTRIHEIIGTQSVSAEYAVHTAGEEFAGIFSNMENDYMKGRATDICDIARRVLNILQGVTGNLQEFVSKPSVIAAEELLPSQTMMLDKKQVLAFVTKTGSVNSHASILARSLGIPMVTALGDGFASLAEGDEVIVDGTKGRIISNPDSSTAALYQKEMEKMEEAALRLKNIIDKPACTKDGATIKLYANIGHPDEAMAALKNGAEGIGLFRSEFLYLGAKEFPSEDQQFDAYKKVLEIMSPRRAVIRTLDLGADKNADYFRLPEEENPAMGYRAIRICLDHPEIFVPQLRALLRASVYGDLGIMFPMITNIEEVRSIRNIIKTVKDNLKSEGIPYSEAVEFGIMIETPAAVMVADKLAEEVDFFSIGTNDLTQYTLAADRMNNKVKYLMEAGRTAVLRMVKMTVDAAHSKGIEVGICGESAADLSLLPCYIAMGIDELSMAAPQILKVKEAVLNLEKASCPEI